MNLKKLLQFSFYLLLLPILFLNAPKLALAQSCGAEGQIPCETDGCNTGLIRFNSFAGTPDVCVRSVNLGDTCSVTSICNQGTCFEGICQEKNAVGIGEDCTQSNTYCEEGTCRLGVCSVTSNITMKVEKNKGETLASEIEKCINANGATDVQLNDWNSQFFDSFECRPAFNNGTPFDNAISSDFLKLSASCRSNSECPEFADCINNVCQVSPRIDDLACIPLPTNNLQESAYLCTGPDQYVCTAKITKKDFLSRLGGAYEKYDQYFMGLAAGLFDGTPDKETFTSCCNRKTSCAELGKYWKEYYGEYINYFTFDYCKQISKDPNDPEYQACNRCLNQEKDANGNPTKIYTAVGCISVQGKGLARDAIRLLMGIAGGIALLSILAAAFLLTISQGDSSKVKQAKELITASVTGLLFMIFSVIILQFIGVTILNIPGLG